MRNRVERWASPTRDRTRDREWERKSGKAEREGRGTVAGNLSSVTRARGSGRRIGEWNRRVEKGKDGEIERDGRGIGRGELVEFDPGSRKW